MKLIQTFLTLLFVTAIMAIIAISITPLFNAYADAAAADRASSEAARLQADAEASRADAAKIDATGDLLNNATLSAIAIGSVCANSLSLMILAVILFVMMRRDLLLAKQKGID